MDIVRIAARKARQLADRLIDLIRQRRYRHAGFRQNRRGDAFVLIEQSGEKMLGGGLGVALGKCPAVRRIEGFLNALRHALYVHMLIPEPLSGASRLRHAVALRLQASQGTEVLCASANPSQSMSAAIAFTGVNKWFGSNHVLNNIELEIAEGEVVVVIGPSGSGKSTLI